MLFISSLNRGQRYDSQLSEDGLESVPEMSCISDNERKSSAKGGGGVC
jgi:hypothetical protein